MGKLRALSGGAFPRSPRVPCPRPTNPAAMVFPKMKSFEHTVHNLRSARAKRLGVRASPWARGGVSLSPEFQVGEGGRASP